MLSQLRYVARVMGRSPATSIAAVLTLALTLGVGTALFALVDAVILTPPPFANPESLVLLGSAPTGDVTAPPRPVSWSTVDRWREYRHVLAQVERFDATNMTLTGRGAATRVSAMAVSPGYFALVGLSPVLGRTWREDEAQNDVIVVSSDFWRTTLGGTPNIIDSELVLGGRRFRILGVVPSRFTNEDPLWVPLRRNGTSQADGGPPVSAIARLVPGATPAGAAQALDEVTSQATPPLRAVAIPVADVLSGTLGRVVPILLVGAVLAVLLAVINLMGLLVVRAIERQREFAVRAALGASPGQIAKQLLLEAHVLVGFGAVGGVLVAYWLTPLAGRFATEQFRHYATTGLQVNWRAILALSVVAWSCAALCGLALSTPGIRGRRYGLMARGVSAGRGELVLRRTLVAAEITIAFVLLASLAVVGQSLQRTFAATPGFNAVNVITAGVSLPVGRYSGPAQAAFYQQLDAALSRRLGRNNVAIVDELPLTGEKGRTFVSAGEGQPGHQSVLRVAGSAYFAALQIPVVQGRGFGPGDDRGAPLRVVVSESLARALFGDARALGRGIRVTGLPRDAEIVGVAGDVKHRAIDERVLPTIYLSAWQNPSPTSTIVVRSNRPLPEVVSVLRAAVAHLDGDLPVYGVRRLEDVVQSSQGIPTRRVMLACFLAFAVLALIVAALGIFGMVSDDVARRRLEFALRVALGANQSQVQGAVARRVGGILMAGLIPGVVLAMAASNMIRALLADITSSDPLALTGVALLLVAVAAVAAVLPARQLTAINPALVLRGD